MGLGKTALLKRRERCILYAYVIIKIVICKLLKNKSQCTSIHIAIFKYYGSYKCHIWFTPELNILFLRRLFHPLLFLINIAHISTSAHSAQYKLNDTDNKLLVKDRDSNLSRSARHRNWCRRSTNWTMNFIHLSLVM